MGYVAKGGVIQSSLYLDFNIQWHSWPLGPTYGSPCSQFQLILHCSLPLTLALILQFIHIHWIPGYLLHTFFSPLLQCLLLNPSFIENGLIYFPKQDIFYPIEGFLVLINKLLLVVLLLLRLLSYCFQAQSKLVTFPLSYFSHYRQKWRQEITRSESISN